MHWSYSVRNGAYQSRVKPRTTTPTSRSPQSRRISLRLLNISKRRTQVSLQLGLISKSSYIVDDHDHRAVRYIIGHDNSRILFTSKCYASSGRWLPCLVWVCDLVVVVVKIKNKKWHQLLFLVTELLEESFQLYFDTPSLFYSST